MRLTTRTLALTAVLGACACVSGCDEGAISGATAVDGGTAPAGLSQQQAQAVVAKVGGRVITLGDYAAEIERMNQFNRLRYQTTERRRELLQEMIDLELLAQEAKRRGLDKQPEVQEAIRQILRDAMLAQARKDLPERTAITPAQVQAYYDANKAKFVDPERRRVSAIVMGDENKAAEVLQSALGSSDKSWGELFFEHSLSAPSQKAMGATGDLSGDLGLVGPPGDPKGANKSIPKSVQKAVFTLDKIGTVLDRVIKDGQRFYIIRLSGRSAGHTRTVAEADGAIRVAIIQDMIRQREAELEADLRKRFPVTVDEAALKTVHIPSGLKDLKPFWEGKDPPAPGSPAPAAPSPATP